MDAALKSLRGAHFIDLTASDANIYQESDLNDLLSLCYYHKSNFLLLEEKNLSAEFFNLSSVWPVQPLQKFANSQVKMAILLPQNAEKPKRYKELMFAMSSSNHVRFYDNRADAEA